MVAELETGFVSDGIFFSCHGRFVYQVVVPKALAPKELVKVFESGEKTVLPPWDPMVRPSFPNNLSRDWT